MIDFAIAPVFLALAGAIGYWIVVLVPSRRQYKVDLGRNTINRNHLELFLLVNDLLAIHEIGYQVVFPDPTLLHRAQTLTTAYREATS